MKRLLILAGLLSALARAQSPPLQGTITNLNSCVYVQGADGMQLQLNVTGQFAGTLVSYVQSIQGGTRSLWPVTATGDSTALYQITSPGEYSTSLLTPTLFSLCFTYWTAGSATVSVTSGSGGGGGSGGGNMVYPGAGIPLSTGSAWATSLGVSGNTGFLYDNAGTLQWLTPGGGVIAESASFNASASAFYVAACTANCTATLPASPPNSNWSTVIQNPTIYYTVTINPNGLTLTGLSSLAPGMQAYITTDGSNYYTGIAPVNAGNAGQLAIYNANGGVVSGDAALSDNGTTLNYTGSGGIVAATGTFSGNLTVNGQLSIAGPWLISSVPSSSPMIAAVSGQSAMGISSDGNFYISANAGIPQEIQTVAPVVTITSSSTPNIAVSSGQFQKITLTANATATASGIGGGSTITIEICQPNSGGPYTWTWPSSFSGGMTIGTSANLCSVQKFVSFTGSSMVAETPGVANVGP